MSRPATLHHSPPAEAALRIALALGLPVLLAACADPGGEPRAEIVGEPGRGAEEEVVETPLYVGEWTLVALEGEPIEEGLAPPELTLGQDGAVAGFTGVNRLTGQAEISWDRKLGVGGFASGPFAVTMMAGEPAAMDLEARFTNALSTASSLRLDGEKLVFRGDDEQDLLVFGRSSGRADRS